ncbi:ABC transporter substrate-binding protein [Scopulibacillus darangshiensis]
MTMKKKLILFSVIIAVILALAGCGKGTDQSKSESDKNTSDTYDIKHAMGKTKIGNDPKRIVSLTNESTEALLAMGIKPVGAVKSWEGDPWYKHIKDKMKGVKVVGEESQVNLEAIAKLHPDLIIGNKMRQEKIYPQLSKIAPTVFSETLRGDWKENFKLYAKAVGKEDKGKEVLQDYDNHVQTLHDKLGDKLNNKISLVRFMPSDIRIYHKDTFAGIILSQVGFKRPANQDKDDFAAQHLTKEMIPKMGGDYIFYFTYETGDGNASKAEKEWTNDPLWKNLSAVKQGHAYQVSDAVWNTSGGVISANMVLDDLEKIFLKDSK